MSNVRIIPPTETDWRAAQAAGMEATALVIDRGLDALGELEAMFEGERDETLLVALRTLAALLRTRRNDRLDLVGELRAAIRPAERASA